MIASDTIYGLSSGSGRSALAVIRISGPASAGVLSSLVGELPVRREHCLRTIRDPETQEDLDKAIVVWLPGPRTFSGEDCAELHLHGSPSVVSAVMSVLGRYPNVRPAEQGEFTRRAFLNGKMDLVEVEGLADLLEARTTIQRRQAFRQMSGVASGVFDAWRQQLLLVRADIEAVVDFVDEPGVAEAAAPGIEARIRALLAEMSEAVGRSLAAEVIRDGVRVVLAGLPNTGKSSLLNILARREAAIVSDIPGTTRDAIEVNLDINGIPVLLTDTAGLRGVPADKIEEEGIRRSQRIIADADVLVWVWSSDIEGSENHPNVTPDLVLQNKCDLESGLLRNESHLGVSTVDGQGIAEFIGSLSVLLNARYGIVESSLLVSARQTAAARRSIRFLNDALEVPGDRLELVAEQIRLASEEIGRLTGKLDVEEWLGAIFSRFCIGK